LLKLGNRWDRSVRLSIREQIEVTPEKLNQPLSRGIHVPVYVYLTVPLAALSVPLEVALPQCPGQIGFVLMLLPALMAAFDGGFRAGLITSLAGAVSLVVAAWCAARIGDIPRTGWWIALPMGWGTALVGCGMWLGRCLEVVRLRADKLLERCEQHERSIYQLHKDSSETAAAYERERVERRQEDAQRLDFSRLLLNIQHLGRELCGNLQMAAVYRLVTDAARKLLKAPNPRLFLLDDNAQELVEHTPSGTGIRLPCDRGMLGWAARFRQIITAEDVAKNHSLADLRDQDAIPWQACAPLVFGQKALGVIGIDAVEERTHEFDRLLYTVANFCAVAVHNGRMFERAEEMARRDGLTGLFNHATFQSRLAELLHQAKKSGGRVAIVISDVDHFKQFNDRHGHQAGDFVLRSLADLWKQLIPSDAFAARYGGEEFVCVFPNTALRDAAQHAEALRFALESLDLEFEGKPLRVTGSFGVAAYPDNADSPAAIIREADAALYVAKGGGRNRVAVAPVDQHAQQYPATPLVLAH
jgi:diguanylate cyclase (GGDEF)-like protein